MWIYTRLKPRFIYARFFFFFAAQRHLLRADKRAPLLGSAPDLAPDLLIAFLPRWIKLQDETFFGFLLSV